MVEIGILEEAYYFEWASRIPKCAISKKNGTLRVVNDFRKLNLLLRCKMSPIFYTKIKYRKMIRSMEGFTFVSALDLNIGYHHIKLDSDAQNLYIIVHSWRKYKYKRLPMDINNV
jgi:hypothetical protein